MEKEPGKIVALLDELAKKDIEIWLEDNNLRYTAPTNLQSELPSLLEHVKINKQAIIEFLKNKTQKAFDIIPIPRDKELPISFSQQRLWLLSQLFESANPYNEFIGFNIVGALDVAVLQKSMAAIVEQHEILRTVFPAVNGEPYLFINNAFIPTINYLDFSSEISYENTAEIEKLVFQEVVTPFDLSTGPLCRIVLIHLPSINSNEQRHILLLVAHHIICDYWSLGILIKELSENYNAYFNKQYKKHEPLSFQYVDFSNWQQQQLQQGSFDSQINYWKIKLANMPKLLELSISRARPLQQSFLGKSLPFVINKEQTNALKAIASKANASLMMILLSAFSMLLARYSRQSDIIIGMPITHRIVHPQLEQLVGLFVNMLPLRLDLSANISCNELIKQVKEVCLSAYENQDIPFEQLVSELKVERNLSISPIFQVAFVFQHEQLPKLELAGVNITHFETTQVNSKFDLTLIIIPTENELSAKLEYATDLFDVTQMERMIGHFKLLLNGIIQDSNNLIYHLPILLPLEQEQIRHWNLPKTTTSNNLTIVALFERQVIKSPNSIALKDETTQLSYQELNQKADQLANHLISLGVKIEDKVGIFIGRSNEMIISMLGVLKAGAAYVPFDIFAPSERLEYITNDADLKFLLTTTELQQKLLNIPIPILCVDKNPTIEKASAVNSIVTINANNLAYVIYTSGTTGKPKGVMITHANVVRLFENSEKLFNFNSEDVWTLFHSFAFDFSVWEIFGALLYGGKLIIVPFITSRTSHKFYELLVDEKVSVLNQTPSAFNKLIEIDRQMAEYGQLNLRYVIFGGEALDFYKLIPWVNKYGYEKPKLINMYGITETTVHVSYYRITHLNDLRNIIGKPLPDLSIHILDEYYQPLPIGVAGELFIEGPGVARGYLNILDLTKERFVEIYNTQQNEISRKLVRLYRSGDLGRYLPDGNIEYLGRADKQVKLNGFRIELKEIETIIANFPSIKNCVVMLQNNVNNEKYLAAILIPKDAIDISLKDLKQYLKEKLPNYMIPSTYYLLDELPLTPNGKIDYDYLKQLNLIDISYEEEILAVNPDIENCLLQIWQEVLNISEISVNDNFFALGGDSILSMQIIARAKQMGLTIQPKDIFQYQTIAELAPVVKTNVVISVSQEPVIGNVLLTPIYQWFFEQNFIKPAHYNQSLLLEVTHDLTLEALNYIWHNLLNHHDILRIRQVKDSNQLYITDLHSLKEVESYIINENLSQYSSNEADKAIERIADELQASLCLAQGPILRIALFKLSDNTQRLLIVIHHFAIDGVSWRILLEDFSQLYNQYQQGLTAQLPLKTISFRDWASALNRYAQTFNEPAVINLWLNQHQNVDNSLLASFSENDKNTVDSVQEITVCLMPEETSALLNSANIAFNTQINDFLLTALAQSIAAWLNTDTIFIDLENHGREGNLLNNLDVSRTVGWFTSLFPLGLTINPLEDRLIDNLKSIKEQLRQIPNNDIEFGILRYLAESYKNILQALPKPHISFNYLGHFNQYNFQTPILGIAKESSGQMRSPKQKRTHLIEIGGYIYQDCLKITWLFSNNIHNYETIKAIADSFLNYLRILIKECTSTTEGGYTPSDFPLANIDQATLDRILSV